MIDRERSAIRAIEQSEDVKQRALAATRRTDDGVSAARSTSSETPRKA